MTKLTNRKFLVGIVLRVFTSCSMFAMDRDIESNVKYEKVQLNDVQASDVVAQLKKQSGTVEKRRSTATQTYLYPDHTVTVGSDQLPIRHLDIDCLWEGCISLRMKFRDTNQEVCRTSVVPLCCACCLGGFIASCLGK